MKVRREFVVTQGWGTSPGLRALKRTYVAPRGEVEIAILEPHKVRAVKGSGVEGQPRRAGHGGGTTRAPRRGTWWGGAQTQRRIEDATYTASRQWRERRRRFVQVWREQFGDEPVCLMCGARWEFEKDDLHHLDYAGLARELFDASWPLRWAHHDARHQRLASSPAWRHLGQRPFSVLILTQLTMQSVGDA